MELLDDAHPNWTIDWQEEEPGSLPSRSRAKTLAVSGVLTYPNRTLLHSSVLIEGNSQTHDNQKDYAQVLFDKINKLAQNEKSVVDEHHCD